MSKSVSQSVSQSVSRRLDSKSLSQAPTTFSLSLDRVVVNEAHPAVLSYRCPILDSGMSAGIDGATSFVTDAPCTVVLQHPL